LQVLHAAHVWSLTLVTLHRLLGLRPAVLADVAALQPGLLAHPQQVLK
jgi:hypothetical protein